MGIGNLVDFQRAGKTFHSLGLVRESEGNLSTFDGARLLITRTGSRLGELAAEDLLDGTLESPPAGASSDLEEHRELYEEMGPGAVVHAHPPGTVPDPWHEGEPHGVYAHGASLERAVAAIADMCGPAAVAGQSAGEGAGPRPATSVTSVTPVTPVTPVVLVDGGVVMLDQAGLPRREAYLALESVEDIAAAIRRLAVRGAPVLGISAAFGLVLAATASTAVREDDLLGDLESAGRLLAETRPTAVNIRWAVDRVLERARRPGSAPGVDGIRRAVLEEAHSIGREDEEACAAIGRLGEELVPRGANVLTHCNTGMLCTGGIGTALGVIYSAHLAGKGIHVWVDETRPALQGARLTAWELGRARVPFTLVADGAAGSLMAAGRVDLVIVGADRIAANGDVANKIGTFPLAVLAGHHGIPFYVAAPTSSIDPDTASGGGIAIEERDPHEVTAPLGLQIAPPGARAANPAFDVTPASLVTAIVTERGVVGPPYESELPGALGDRRRA